MKVVKPVTITDAILTSSSVAENDFAEWSAATTYAVDQKCIMASTHRIYKSLQNSNLNKQPDQNLTGTTPYWLDIGPTNRWGMLDGQVGTSTSAANSIAVTLEPGRVNSLALLELDGAQSVAVTVVADTEEVYSNTINLVYGTPVSDWYGYFFDEITAATDLILTDLPPYSSAEITATITGGGSVSCGILIVGNYAQLGNTEYGCSLGIVDYSVKETDDFGNTILVQRKYVKTLDASMFMHNAEIDRIHKVLASFRATPALWVGVDYDFYTKLAVYGFFRDFSIQIPYPTHSTCSLQIEGMI